MPTSVAPSPSPVVLVSGEDDFHVRERARQLLEAWRGEAGDADTEIIDGNAGNTQEALRVLARLHEALQTLPFFGSTKIVWLRNVNFLGDERTAGTRTVTEALADLAASLKRLPWDRTRLLISAAKVDRRKSLVKTIEKMGAAENYPGLSLDDSSWQEKAGAFVREQLAPRAKSIEKAALAEILSRVGPHLQILSLETEKLQLYAWDRPAITLADVAVMVPRNKQARAFALGDAFGDRNLPAALELLDEELWSLKYSSQKTEVGLLYGLIAKARTLLLLRELLEEEVIRPESSYYRFKAQLAEAAAASRSLPQDRRFNPFSMHPYVLFKAIPQTRRYTTSELIQAMRRLLEANLKLVASDVDKQLVLQHVLIQIMLPAPATPASAQPAAGQ